MLPGDDDALVCEVKQLLKELATPRRHHIAAGLLLEDGQTVTAINLASNFGPGSLCAEQVAIATWAKSPQACISAIVAVRATFDASNPFEIVAPCGHCREFAYEYAPQCRFLVPNPAQGIDYLTTQIVDLLPTPFQRRQT
jgi:cytidine deaminase